MLIKMRVRSLDLSERCWNLCQKVVQRCSFIVKKKKKKGLWVRC